MIRTIVLSCRANRNFYIHNLVQACGAKYYIQGESLDEIDVDDVVVALVNLARKVS